jgi:glycosyltransferase involved in cell wall biosynthesis
MTNDRALEQTKNHTRIAICIATCFRPDGLQRLLDGISKQKFSKNDPPKLLIIVIDNDAEGSSKKVCDEFATNSLIQLIYDIEPQRGIPFARNRGIDHAIEVSDYIAIIDDDEVPTVGWIDELLYTLLCYTADVVTGPVLPHFVDTPPNWAVEGKFYEKTGMTTGQIVNNCFGHVYTSNLLARTDIFHKVKFSEQFASNGADDTHLFMQIDQAGYKVVWSDDALVTEWLPASRTTTRWILQRGFRGGNGFALSEIAINPSLHVRIERGMKGVAHIIRGLVLAGLSLGCKAKLIRSLQTTFVGAGMIVAVLGKRYDEYKTIHSV